VNPARRDFPQVYDWSTLASALSCNAAQIRRRYHAYALVVDLVGPMAFKKGNGVMTSGCQNLVEKERNTRRAWDIRHSIVLPQHDYVITGPTPYGGDPTIYGLLTARFIRRARATTRPRESVYPFDSANADSIVALDR